VNELPFLAFYYLAASTALAIAQGDVDTPVGWIAFTVAILTMVGLAIVAWRARRAGSVADQALSRSLGADAAIVSMGQRLPLARILLSPFLVRRHDVERVRNLSYGDAGRRNLLDLYRHRSHPSGGPILIHLHGGRFVQGKKNREALPLIYRLASQGWICISANYRLSPAFPDDLIDVKKAIAWAREHAPGYGADPTMVFVAGSSAGGHLAATAALTQNDPALQPGVESGDTSVAAAIALGAYLSPRRTDRWSPSSPGDSAGTDTPPFFVAHGDRDTVVPVETTRLFVERLRRTSSNPVVYVELPGAQHAFDLVNSIRFDTVVNAIEVFVTWVRSQQAIEH
jgi:acetyl esterase/lipase